ncbi:MAG: TonB-dependent receptor [Novosphingobium sp.]
MAALMIGGMCAFTSANAAEVVDAPASPQSVDDSEAGEIIVTANRRTQSINDVGLSVTSFEGSSLKERGVASVSDLQKVVPGFSAADTGLNVPVYSIRGIGFNDSSLASNSTVAVSVDEIPLPYTAMTQGAVLDLQRLEVVKGPQGTLYGQNSTGGAINYIANKPTNSFAFGGQVGFARFNTATGEVFVSGPLSETVKARLSVSGTLGSDWQKSFTRDDSLGQVAKAAARLQLAWDAADRLNVQFIGSGWIDRSDTPAAQIIGFRPQTPANVARFPQTFNSPLTPLNARAANWDPTKNYARNDSFYQLALKASYDLGSDIQLTSISAYSHYKTQAYNDRDGIVPTNFQFTTNGKITSFYQELRLGGTSGALTWSVGGNYRKDHVYDYQLNDLIDATNTFTFGKKFNNAVVFSDQHVETFAIFADGEYEIVPSLSVVGGVRYTKDTRRFEGCSADSGDGLTSSLYTTLSAFFRGRAGLAPLAPLAPGVCVTLAPPTFTSGLVTDRLSEDNVAFRAGLNFKPTTDTLIYGTFSRGYKAGSFPTLGAAFAIGYGAANQERVDAIELGVKAAFLDRKLNINAALFDYDYRDKQLRGRIIDPVAGNLSKLVNIPKTKIQGFEVEASVRPFSGLTLNGAVTYIKTEIKEFVGINFFNTTENFVGQTLPFTPAWSVNGGGEYRFAMDADKDLFAGADLTYRSKTSGFIGNDPGVGINAYTTLDLRAGVEAKDGRWKFTVWGNNVTNAYYWSGSNRNSDTLIHYAARPATYGILFGWKY